MIDASPLAERLAPSIGQRLGNKAGGADIAGLALVADLADLALHGGQRQLRVGGQRGHRPADEEE